MLIPGYLRGSKEADDIVIPCLSALHVCSYLNALTSSMELFMICSKAKASEAPNNLDWRTPEASVGVRAQTQESSLYSLRLPREEAPLT